MAGHINLMDSNTPPDKVLNVPGVDMRSDNENISFTRVSRNASIG